MRYLLLILLLVVLAGGGCATKGQTGAAGGAAVGAAIGQAIGHDTGATLIGAAVGTLVGYIVGNEMDTYDREQLNHSYERGVSHQPSAWVNPDKGNQYRVVPEPAYQNPTTQQVCRRAEINAVINGKAEKTQATACRDRDGHWEIQ